MKARLHWRATKFGCSRGKRNCLDWLGSQSPDNGRTWVGVAPGSKMPAKRWDLARFAEVVRGLIDHFDIWPVVFGGGEDRTIGRNLLDQWGRGYNAAGQLSVRASAFAVGRAALFLGNDSGAMHLAAAAGTPCVAIFSSRDWPGAWYPYAVRQKVFRSDIDCEGCYLTECTERANECLKRIGTAEVLEACRLFLDPSTERRLSTDPGGAEVSLLAG